jgi:hypothetical protein
MARALQNRKKLEQFGQVILRLFPERIDSEPVGFIHRDASRCLLRDAITSASRQCSVRDECSLRFAIRWLTRDCRSNHRFTSTSLLPLRSCGLSH